MKNWQFFFLLLVAGCEFHLPDFKNYPLCQPACVPGCVCLAGSVCVPEKEPFDPRCCQAASCPECQSNRDCPNPQCTCQRGICLTPAQEHDPQFCGRTSPSCEAGNNCNFGCTCQNNICVPPPGEPDPEFCSHGYNTCFEQTDCRVGCECRQGRCWPRADDISYLYCAGQKDDANNQELLCRGPSYTVFDVDQLRQALEDATTTAHPYGIIFHQSLQEMVLEEDLPPVPSLVWIDGGAGRSGPILFRGQGAKVGLKIVGSGVVIKNIRFAGFPEAALAVEGSAQDVHLLRLRVGDATNPNQDGIVIKPGAFDISLGRGREIGLFEHCLQIEEFPLRSQCQTADLDVNVIVSNWGDGIRAEGVKNLLIEGTWVGFDLENDCDQLGSPRPDLANGGAGIKLIDVRNAHLGVRYLTPEELQGSKDFRPGCLAVGRNARGGVEISGGGDMVFHCALLGHTPYMVPYFENGEAGLIIKENDGEIFFGPPASARGFAAETLNLVHVTTTPAMKIISNKSRIWVRGTQLQSLGKDETFYPNYLVEISAIQGPVDFVHVSIFGHVKKALFNVQNEPTGKFSLINSFLGEFVASPAAVVEYSGPAQNLVLDHIFKLRYGPWCNGDCSVDPSYLWEESNLTGIWDQQGNRPLSPECPVVDRARPLELDVNGTPEGEFTGCCPDLGAFECISTACANRLCTGINCD